MTEEEEERKGSKTSQRHSRAGQEASCPPCFFCNDRLCWQPVGWAVLRTLEPRWDNPSAGHFMSFEDIKHLQLHASLSPLAAL